MSLDTFCLISRSVSCPPADFVSVLLPQHFGVAARFVPARN